MKERIRNYRDLEVWQKAMDLVVECYSLCKNFPKNEMYGLQGQLQRAAISVPANIAEGNQRQHSKEFIQHLSIASGSVAELETHIQIAGRLNYIAEKDISDLLHKTSEIGKMIHGLRKSIKKNLTPDP